MFLTFFFLKLRVLEWMMGGFHHNLDHFLWFKSSNFSFLLERINNRIVGWKSELLNQARRITLANSVLATIPYYTMENLWVPESICNKIDSRMRCFIWGGTRNNWVDRSTIHKSRQMNTTLLGKNIWALLHDQHKLWFKIL